MTQDDSSDVRGQVARALELELDKMDYAELHQAKDTIRAAMRAASFAISSMKTQIENARMMADVEKQLPDEDWWFRVNDAMAIMRGQRLRLEEKQAGMNKRINRARQARDRAWRESRALMFVRVAETTLPLETIRRLWKRVDEEEGRDD